ncbi:MAG: hypothetical protein JSW34_08735 [Candidatus Zixiibacteriota bacterium]|nr:MAG: hypothetical protein JSW34_08735 [candidate division Zixibacteria bacterium]
MFARRIQSRAAKWGLLASMLAAFALFSGLYLPGCSDNPAGSSDVTESGETSFFDLPFDEVELAKKVADPTTLVTVALGEQDIIAADGGLITLVSVGTSATQELLVPENTLPYDVTISIELLRLESKKSRDVTLIYECLPDGLVFTQPAILKLDLVKTLGKKATCAHMYWLNPVTNQWESQGDYYPDAAGFVYLPFWHFSRWGVD